MTEIHRDEIDDIVCRELVETVTEYLEGALDPATAAAVERHLALCPQCERYLEQMRETISAAGRVPVESLSDQAKAALVTAFRDFHSADRGPAKPGSSV